MAQGSWALPLCGVSQGLQRPPATAKPGDRDPLSLTAAVCSGCHQQVSRGPKTIPIFKIFSTGVLHILGILCHRAAAAPPPRSRDPLDLC